MSIRRKYHASIGFPVLVADAIHSLGDLQLSYTKHAMRACVEDRYGPLTHPPFLVRPSLNEIFEVETRNGVLVKLVVRQRYNELLDIILAIDIDPLCVARGFGLVKTVWANHVNDNHKTLDASQYDKP